MKNILFLLLACLLATAETVPPVVISPNMNLPVPEVGVTPGPGWATDVNACMSAIDQHDHTPGKGVPISSQAININSSLPMNNNALTSVAAVNFSSQTSYSTNQSLYVESPDLFYNDGNGNIIRITQSGSVAGASGTITGLPSGTASASYQSGTGTFQFQSSTNTPANGSFASISIAQQTATPNLITLKSPNSLAASYNFTFPAAVPSYTSLLTMSTSGVLSTVPYLVPTIQVFSTGTGTYSPHTNPSPVYVVVRSVGAGGGGGGTGSGGAGGNGGNTTLGGTTVIANGGTGGPNNANTLGGAGGGASFTGSGLSGVSLNGGDGGAGGSPTGASSVGLPGGLGGSSCYSGAGSGGGNGGINGNSGYANTGGGGGGGGSPSGGQQSAGGGGGGGCVEVFVTGSTLASWISSGAAYSIGAGGTAGAPGLGATAGGVGGSGGIEIKEYYQ